MSVVLHRFILNVCNRGSINCWSTCLIFYFKKYFCILAMRGVRWRAVGGRGVSWPRCFVSRPLVHPSFRLQSSGSTHARAVGEWHGAGLPDNGDDDEDGPGCVGQSMPKFGCCSCRWNYSLKAEGLHRKRGILQDKISFWGEGTNGVWLLIACRFSLALSFSFPCSPSRSLLPSHSLSLFLFLSSIARSRSVSHCMYHDLSSGIDYGSRPGRLPQKHFTKSFDIFMPACLKWSSKAQWGILGKHGPKIGLELGHLVHFIQFWRVAMKPNFSSTRNVITYQKCTVKHKFAVHVNSW